MVRNQGRPWQIAKEDTLATWNDTAFEKALSKALSSGMGSEKGEAYMALYIRARTTLLEEVLRRSEDVNPT